jgi:hypothetical protein
MFVRGDIKTLDDAHFKTFGYTYRTDCTVYSSVKSCYFFPEHIDGLFLNFKPRLYLNCILIHKHCWTYCTHSFIHNSRSH